MNRLVWFLVLGGAIVLPAGVWSHYEARCKQITCQDVYKHYHELRDHEGPWQDCDKCVVHFGSLLDNLPER